MNSPSKIFLVISVLLVSTLSSPAQGDYWMQAEGPCGGLIQAMAVDSAGTVLAGTLNGGVFRSTDHGQTWTPASTGLGALSVSSLGVYQDGTWFAGVFGGAKLYRSSNQGESWTSSNTGLGLSSVDALLCADTLIIACGFYGVYTSKDSGKSWTDISNVLSTLEVNDVALEPGGGLYAGTDRGIFYSTDWGTNWEQRNSGLAADTSVLNIQIAPGGAILLSTSYNKGIYRSTDHGLSWTKKSTGIPSGYNAGLMITSDGNAFASIQHADLYRSTDLGDTWYPVSGLLQKDVRGMSPSGSGDLYAGEFGAGVSRSTDAGLTWVQGIQGMSASHVAALAHSASGLLVAATSGAGMHRSTDDGRTWNQAITGLANVDVRSTAISPDGIIYAGTFGGGVFRSDDDGITWSPKGTGMGSTEVYAFLVIGADSVFAGCRNTGIYRSSDRGETWVPSDSGFPTYATIHCLARFGDGMMAAGTNSLGVFVSTDGGMYWVQRDSGLTTKDVRSIVASSATTLFAGTYGGGIFRSTDGGMTWQAVNSGYEYDGNALVLASNGNLFAGGNNSVYLSTNQGDSWTQNTTGMGYPRVYSLDISPNGTVIAGTYGNGVYYSAVSVGVREHAGDWLPSAPSLEQNYPNPFNPTTTIQVIVGGVVAPQQNSGHAPSGAFRSGAEGHAPSRAFRSGAEGSVIDNVKLEVFDILGRKVSTLAEGRYPAGRYTFTFNGRSFASGVYYYRLQSGSYVETKAMVLMK